MGHGGGSEKYGASCLNGSGLSLHCLNFLDKLKKNHSFLNCCPKHPPPQNNTAKNRRLTIGKVYLLRSKARDQKPHERLVGHLKKPGSLHASVFKLVSDRSPPGDPSCSFHASLACPLLVCYGRWFCCTPTRCRRVCIVYYNDARGKILSDYKSITGMSGTISF